jgi:chromosome segregation ATPase
VNYTRKEYIHQMRERIKAIEGANTDYELELAEKEKEIETLKLQRDVLGGGFERLRSELAAMSEIAKTQAEKYQSLLAENERLTTELDQEQERNRNAEVILEQLTEYIHPDYDKSIPVVDFWVQRLEEHEDERRE